MVLFSLDWLKIRARGPAHNDAVHDTFITRDAAQGVPILNADGPSRDASKHVTYDDHEAAQILSRF